MRLLLDTHAFLWWITNDERLSARCVAALSDRETEVYLSVAAAWEMAIKYPLGRLKLDAPPDVFIPREIKSNGIIVLPVSLPHVLRTAALPPIHRDPFDRLMVAQSQIEQMDLVTVDPLILKYVVNTFW
jgi:PIN domain nuclease of toxin-antitoxin system